MDSYDNDWLFLDDDLFFIWLDERKEKNEKASHDKTVSDR